LLKEEHKLQQKMFPENYWNNMLSKVMTPHSTVMGDKSWFHHVDRDIKWHCVTHHPRKRSQKQCLQPVRPWELSFGMLKDAYWSGFCHKGEPSMLLITFRHSTSYTVHCVTNVQGRRYPATMHNPTPFFCVCRGFKRMAGSFSLILPTVWT
jgi:hypothetical protein